ncbi:MAG TPA: hypothetical protein VHK27_15515, partial [Gammaproteobacteria bacterium]|nr:hypothetical protein [Gammaproteobacteria bacterium]
MSEMELRGPCSGIRGASRRNYELPEHPVAFPKAPTSINSSFSDTSFDVNLSSRIDWEIDPGIVIG